MTNRFGLFTTAAVMFAAIVVQTTLLNRVTIGGMAPEISMLAIVLLALRVRPETLMAVSFVSGLILDALGSFPLGLRAMILTVVAFLASKTTERAEYSPLAAAVWVGIHTLAGVVLLVVVGTLVSQVSLEFDQAVRRMLLIPLLNVALALLAWPLVARLLEPVRRLA